MRERSYRFYVEPIGPFTNESISDYLANKDIGAGIQAQIRHEGKPINVWLVRHEVITQLENGKLVFPFKYRTFEQEGEGKIRPYKLRRRKMSVHSRLAQKRLQEIGARK